MKGVASQNPNSIAKSDGPRRKPIEIPSRSQYVDPSVGLQTEQIVVPRNDKVRGCLKRTLKNHVVFRIAAHTAHRAQDID